MRDGPFLYLTLHIGIKKRWRTVPERAWNSRLSEVFLGNGARPYPRQRATIVTWMQALGLRR
jgi:hypothetical protein